MDKVTIFLLAALVASCTARDLKNIFSRDDAWISELGPQQDVGMLSVMKMHKDILEAKLAEPGARQKPIPMVAKELGLTTLVELWSRPTWPKYWSPLVPSLYSAPQTQHSVPCQNGLKKRWLTRRSWQRCSSFMS